MKNSILFRPLIFCLFSFLLSGNLLSADGISFGRDFSKSEENVSSAVLCNVPTWPTTSNITQSSARFTWDAVYGAQSYSLQTRLLNGTWYDVPGGPIYNTSVTVTGFNSNTTYQWRVRANCANGEYSNFTAGTTFTTAGAACYHPTWLNTSSITSTSANLDWDPVSGAMSYTMYHRQPSTEQNSVEHL